MLWWVTLKNNVREELQQKHSCNRNFLTGREIEIIYNEEHQVIKDIPLSQTEDKDVCDFPKQSKANEKQFKNFDESLFLSYIDKFKPEDKEKAIKLLGGYTKKELTKEHLFNEDCERDDDMIVISNGNLFRGTRLHFAACYFSNAHNANIIAWCHSKNYSSLTINGIKII